MRPRPDCLIGLLPVRELDSRGERRTTVAVMESVGGVAGDTRWLVGCGDGD
jgi:hypothetical protein